MPSMAVDIAPIKYVGKKASIDWADTGAFRILADLMKEIAREQKTDIIWGGDWSSLKDFVHFELKGK